MSEIVFVAVVVAFCSGLLALIGRALALDAVELASIKAIWLRSRSISMDPAARDALRAMVVTLPLHDERDEPGHTGLGRSA